MTTVRAELREAFATVAVTGTNGKTTTTSMVESIVSASGEAHARVTTLGAWVNGEQLVEGSELEAFALAIERAAASGVKTLALETTSRALAQGFSHGWPARVAVFTNLTRDHLDYHGDPERYLAAKAQLFMTLPQDGAAVLNACDSASALIEEVTAAGARRLGYASSRERISQECAHIPLELVAKEVEATRSGTRIRLEPSPLADALGGELGLAVVGEVNAENALAAALAAHALGYSPAAIRSGLEEFTGVRGRFERVFSDPLVVVDYAHSPDALARTLGLARKLAGTGKLVCVFGCGGGADRGKRPEMGRIAVENADVVLVTSDNPRNEDPAAIADDVLAGAREGAQAELRTPGSMRVDGSRWMSHTAECRVSLDRAVAIREAIAIVEPGRSDIVVIAGKGHETTQTAGGTTLAFDDAEVARAACREQFESEDG